jgi:hypothetical protein
LISRGPALGGVDRPLQGGDGVGVAARPEPGDHLEVIQIAGGDHQVVEPQQPLGGLDLLGGGVDRGGFAVYELDVVGGEGLGHREHHVFDLAPAEGDPDEGRVELELIRLGQHGDVHAVLQFVLEAERGGQAGEVPPKHQHLLGRHPPLLSSQASS